MRRHIRYYCVGMTKTLSTFLLAELSEEQLAPLLKDHHTCNYCDSPISYHMAWSYADQTHAMEQCSAWICSEHARQVSAGMSAVLKLPAANTVH